MFIYIYTYIFNIMEYVEGVNGCRVDGVLRVSSNKSYRYHN